MDTADLISKLRDLRDSIDNIDAAIVHLLAERFRCTHAVGKLKARHGRPSRDPDSEAEQIRCLRHLAAVSKLDPDFAEKFLAFVIREVIRHTNRFGAEPLRAYFGMSLGEPGVGDWHDRSRSHARGATPCLNLRSAQADHSPAPSNSLDL